MFTITRELKNYELFTVTNGGVIGFIHLLCSICDPPLHGIELNNVLKLSCCHGPIVIC
jgi:hypothetical protein